MDAYILSANAITCLGSGETLWDNLVAGNTGLSSAKYAYPGWYPDKESKVGVIKSIQSTRSRLLQIMESIGEISFPQQIYECQLILGASSLGDLEGPYTGDPFSCFQEYFKTSHLELMPKFRGVISSACSSGTDVVSLAAMMVDKNEYDCIGVIGADCLDAGKLLQHFSLGTQSDNRAMPFDINRDGTSFGEGGGFMIVANSKGIKRLNLEPSAQILGFGMSCDAMYITAPDETGNIPALAIKRALISSKCNPKDIGYINAHASGTKINDQVETIALRKAFGDAIEETAISGTKGAIGHLLGSTGLVELIISSWAISKSTAPGTVGLINKDKDLNIPVIKQGETKSISGKLAISTTFGFGGVNSAVVISKVI